MKFLLLDLDDTILDFGASEAEGLRKTLLSFGIDPTDEIVRRYSEINDAQWKLLELGKLTRLEVKRRRFEILFEWLGVERDVEAVRLYYERVLGEFHVFYDGAEQFLRDVYGKYALYIVSNGTTAVQNGRIASAGIADYFDGIFLSEEIGYVKPQREFFEACFSKIPGFDASDAIILGDSLTSDIQGGINAGIRTCWFNPKGKEGRADIQPDFEVRSLTEFVALLEQI